MYNCCSPIVTEKQSTITLLAINNGESDKKCSAADTNTSTGAKTDTVAKNNKPFEESDTDTSELLNQITIYNSDSDISLLPSPVTQLDKQYSKCGDDHSKLYNNFLFTLHFFFQKF